MNALFEKITALLETLLAEIENQIPKIENPPNPGLTVKIARLPKPTQAITNQMLFQAKSS